MLPLSIQKKLHIKSIHLQKRYFFNKEINLIYKCQNWKRNELFQKTRVGQQKKEKMPLLKHLGLDEFANNLSKDIPIYASFSHGDLCYGDHGRSGK